MTSQTQTTTANDFAMLADSDIRLLCQVLSSPSRLEALRRVVAEPGIQTQQLNASNNGPRYARELARLGLVRAGGKSGRERLCHPDPDALPIAEKLLALPQPKKLSRVLKLPGCLAALRMLHASGDRLRQDYLYASIWESENGWRRCVEECHYLYQSGAVLHAWKHRGENKAAHLWLNPEYAWLAGWLFGTRQARKPNADKPKAGGWTHRGAAQAAVTVKAT